MTTSEAFAQGLTISDLAGATGVTPATLRAWETRHGFPVPTRRQSGHRRYDAGDVALVRDVVRRRDAGVRLEVAIAEARATTGVRSTTSVFAELRRSHPHLPPQQLRKSTLLALSWAIEDECCARAQTPVLFAAFQHARYFTRAQRRWEELARTARSTVVLADFGGSDDPTPGLTRVHLPEEAPMRREWSVVCDAVDCTAALAAWELPGQSSVPDADRIFEAVWTLEPGAVRDAARMCARLTDLLLPTADHDWSSLDPPAAPATPELRAATTLFRRLLGYVDRTG